MSEENQQRPKTSVLHKVGSVLAFIFNKLFMVSLVILILVFVPIVVISSTITNPNKVKTILNEGDVYNTVIDNALKIIEVEPDQEDSKQNEDSDEQSLYETLEQNNLIDPKGLEQVFKNSYDSEFLKSQVEPNIDSLYSYLDGSTDNLAVNISLNERSDKFQQEFKKYLKAELANIPECTPEQTANLDQSKDQNLLEQPCLPAGTQVDDQIDKTIDNFASDSPLNEDLNSEDLGLSTVDLNNARLGYSSLSKLPLIFWFMFALISAAIIMTAKTTYRGFKEVGIISLIAGILLVIQFAIIGSADFFRDRVVNSEDTSLQNQAIINIAEPLANSVASVFQSSGITYGTVIAVIGVITFIAGIFLKRHHYEHIHLPHLRHKPNQSESK